jgi:hypothetical protein
MTFDELIERNEEPLIEHYDPWDEVAWLEREECTLDLLQWYLALIITSV